MIALKKHFSKFVYLKYFFLTTYFRNLRFLSDIKTIFSDYVSGEVKPKAVVAQDASETISISSDSEGSSSGSDDSDTDSEEERYY